MPSEPIYKLDFSQLNAKLKQYQQLCKSDYAPEGIRKACQEIILDANNVPPRTPFKWGALRGSGKVDKVEKQGDQIIGQVSFGAGASGQDAPYAARWHEAEPGSVKFTAPGAGPKYLESKLNMFREKYMKIIAEVIRRRTG